MSGKPRIDRVLEMLDALTDLDVAESNGNFQHMIFDAVEKTGRDVNDFTIREMRALIADVRADFNVRVRPYI